MCVLLSCCPRGAFVTHFAGDVCSPESGSSPPSVRPQPSLSRCLSSSTPAFSVRVFVDFNGEEPLGRLNASQSRATDCRGTARKPFEWKPFHHGGQFFGSGNGGGCRR